MADVQRHLFKGQPKLAEYLIRVFLFVCAVLSIFTTAGIIWVLLRESFTFFTAVSPLEFLLGTRWAPLLEPRSFGVLPLVCGTTLVVVGAALVSLPLGLASGLYLSEYASGRTRGILKPV
ncbi:MAG TPA: hypothetical protein VMZ27_18330, partial [Candidatus Saccharimonadales bacterium]|nr:hypothetical protein [Candidatus Saccharimonadales bacterium]